MWSRLGVAITIAWVGLGTLDDPRHEVGVDHLLRHLVHGALARLDEPRLGHQLEAHVPPLGGQHDERQVLELGPRQRHERRGLVARAGGEEELDASVRDLVDEGEREVVAVQRLGVDACVRDERGRLHRLTEGD